MSFDDYARHIAQKYRLAISIAILNIKPTDLSIDEFINQLKNINDDELNISACSDDFDVDSDDVNMNNVDDMNQYTNDDQNYMNQNRQNNSFENDHANEIVKKVNENDEKSHVLTRGSKGKTEENNDKVSLDTLRSNVNTQRKEKFRELIKVLRDDTTEKVIDTPQIFIDLTNENPVENDHTYCNYILKDSTDQHNNFHKKTNNNNIKTHENEPNDTNSHTNNAYDKEIAKDIRKRLNDNVLFGRETKRIKNLTENNKERTIEEKVNNLQTKSVLEHPENIKNKTDTKLTKSDINLKATETTKCVVKRHTPVFLDVDTQENIYTETQFDTHYSQSQIIDISNFLIDKQFIYGNNKDNTNNNTFIEANIQSYHKEKTNEVSKGVGKYSENENKFRNDRNLKEYDAVFKENNIETFVERNTQNYHKTTEDSKENHKKNDKDCGNYIENKNKFENNYRNLIENDAAFKGNTLNDTIMKEKHTENMDLTNDKHTESIYLTNDNIRNDKHTENMYLINDKHTESIYLINDNIRNDKHTKDMDLTNDKHTESIYLTNDNIRNDKHTENMYLTNDKHTENIYLTNDIIMNDKHTENIYLTNDNIRNDKHTKNMDLTNDIIMNDKHKESMDLTKAFGNNRDENVNTLAETEGCTVFDSLDSNDIDKEGEEKIPFKIIEEVNRIKIYLRRNENMSSGYRSTCSQNISFDSSQNQWIGQSACNVFNYLNNCSLLNSTHDIIQQISEILGQLVDKLHEEESYPPFLEELLITVDKTLHQIYEEENYVFDVLLKKDEQMQRILLLNKSSHIQKFTIEKINRILEKLINIDSVIQEINKIENVCYIFQILQILIPKYNSFKEEKSQESISKKIGITDVWRKKWMDKKIESNEGSCDTKCVLQECSDILNKIIIKCMDGYSLIAFYALKCFNLMQS